MPYRISFAIKFSNVYRSTYVRIRVVLLQTTSLVSKRVEAVFWPGKRQTNKHPERWTGRVNLLEDVNAADLLLGDKIRSYLGVNLEQFYEFDYRRLNWFVHGSGYVGYSYPHEVLYLMSSTDNPPVFH